MICIFSSVSDHSTTDVIRWLRHLGVSDVLRINSDDDSDYPIALEVRSNTLAVRFESRVISLSEITAVWYRKGSNWFCNQFDNPTFPEHPALSKYMSTKLRREEARLTEYFHYLIQDSVPSLGSMSTNNPNKLLVLRAASDAGLVVPRFLISNSIQILRDEICTNQPFITKAISDGLYLFDDVDGSTGYYSYTEDVVSADFDDLTDFISPSLIQEKIFKQFELRVFILQDRAFAMAIFSQSDEQTKVDFRKYNESVPNRTVPFALPGEISEKLFAVFRSLGLTTGSVDMIVDQADRFVFLEINPVGQFGMVSTPCNYFLEREIALALIDYENSRGTN
jgi:ATP-GRASP peptide maturase of grasp-with-spasm system